MRIVLACVALHCATSAPLCAQEPPATISGRVVDEKGNPIGDAMLRLYDGHQVTDAVTATDGSFVINTAGAGPCQLRAYADRSTTFETRVICRPGESIRLNLVMQAAARAGIIHYKSPCGPMANQPAQAAPHAELETPRIQ
ncbi:MAG: carboxypeptidase regulatory-like domain-containing protein [Bacteroidetes bacterium]|nr:carboxypeptidase regulatory-like domain-containing protein [Bacteroidota bacterium]